jgi:hypothetical protein|tara:strand:- start:287 stop:577 length:291 start_codon:yes stop_codon:yes gene_type:complete
MLDIMAVIQSLRPNAQLSVRGDVVEWLDTVQTEPTAAEIATEVTRLQAAYDAQAYARSRKAAYDLLNQDEMRYDDLINSTTTWQDAIAAIKLEYPQ